MATLALSRRDIAALLDLDSCIAAVEEAFRAYGAGVTPPPGALSHPTADGGFHVKAASLRMRRWYFATKVNGNFFHNEARFGLPRIQGVVALCDAENGVPLAVMDSVEITTLRTGAATAVAAKYLARADAATATIVGCGVQGRVQLRALARVRPLRAVRAYDVDPAAARRFADELGPELGIGVDPVADLRVAARAADVVVTCTASRQPLLYAGDVAEGAFVAAVGADSSEKQEIDPSLLASSAVVVDLLEQCASFGDLRHALATGAMTRDGVRGELGEIVAGRKPGRLSAHETIVFDSTGTALQDVAAAATVYERAIERGVGHSITLE